MSGFFIMKLFFILLFLLTNFAKADVVKPALVEVSIFKDKTIQVEIDLSLEAAMTGIGTQYKNTQDAPNSDEYDVLRALEPEALRQKFSHFEQDFMQSFALKVNQKPQPLMLSHVDIDIVGYKQRPRKSVLTYTGKLQAWPKTITWQYDQIYGDNALRWQVYQADEYNWSQWQWLRDGEVSEIIDINHPEPLSKLERFSQFVGIGFDHVIPLGWDHILFIVGMALSSLLWRKLLVLVSLFTLAHTLTLGLAMYGVVEISPQIIEPLIAFSIAYVAIENLIIQQSMIRQSLVIFFFGLIHGLGFATMLKEFEMTQDSFLTTLIGFNVGVEIAQVAIVLAVVAILLLMRKFALNYRRLAIIPTSIIISIIGIWWGVERLIA